MNKAVQSVQQPGVISDTRHLKWGVGNLAGFSATSNSIGRGELLIGDNTGFIWCIELCTESVA